MGVVNPCCCCPLRCSVIFISLINMVLCLVGTLWQVLAALVIFFSGVKIKLKIKLEGDLEQNDAPGTSDTMEEKATESHRYTYMLFTLTLALSFLVAFVMSFILLIGAIKKDYGKIRAWLAIMLVIVGYHIFFKGLILIFEGLGQMKFKSDNDADVFEIQTTPQPPPRSLYLDSIYLSESEAVMYKEGIELFATVIIAGFQFLVVYAFLKEIRAQRNQSYAQVPMAEVAIRNAVT